MRITVDRPITASARRAARALTMDEGIVAVAVLALAAAVSLTLSGCSAVLTSDDDAWVAAYVDNPDRVWAAIHQSLAELGYEVEDENRLEGTIHAAAIADRSYQGVALHIDQIQRTEVVRVHVRPSGGSAGGPDSYARLDEAAREFLADLDGRLGGRSAP